MAAFCKVHFDAFLAWPARVFFVIFLQGGLFARLYGLLAWLVWAIFARGVCFVFLARMIFAWPS